MLAWLFRVGLAGSLALVAAACVALTDHNTRWPCSVDSDCLAGEHCVDDNSRRVCMPFSACNMDSECPDRHRCVNGTGYGYLGTCTVIQCTSQDADPCDGPLCEVATGTCRVGCTSLNDCSAGYLCQNGACLRGMCTPTNSSVCGGVRCQVDGLCGKGCQSSSDCEAGKRCTNSQCL